MLKKIVKTIKGTVFLIPQSVYKITYIKVAYREEGYCFYLYYLLDNKIESERFVCELNEKTQLEEFRNKMVRAFEEMCNTRIV